MRLTAMKLSGFKSFVEPTTIKFPSNLMGIVGPNGCGKSNVIDAVRWVMGETSARQLRGESMSDVIFSGSSSRKPVATATVELIFDNSDGRAGGEYADYNEISVKRQVTRDGQSSYWLNGTKCRKKDITNLFLGTGLGPRSYAIIEQGMISQIVEARPEDLRAFLEEAAGISRYKERRRETENRIRHTRENLERLSDLREEVTKHLDKLKRQANAAERYKKLKARYRDDEARLMALRWREMKARSEGEEKALREVENQLQSALSTQRSAEKELEELRQGQHQSREAVSKVQGELYEVAGEIARIEQAIDHQREIRKRQQAEYSETESQLNELKQHLVLDKAQVEENSELLARLNPELETAREAEKEAQSEVERVDEALESWQERWQAHQEGAGNASSEAELLRQRIEHLDDRMNRAAERLKVLDEQSGDSAAERLAEEKSRLEEQIAASEKRIGEMREAIESKRARVSELRSRIEQLRNDLETARAERHERETRVESLRLLNRGEDNDEDIARWLETQGLDAEARILHRIEISEPEWNRAVETVLEDWLQAVRVDGVDAHLGDDLPEAGLRMADGSETSARPGTLAEKVGGAGALGAVLSRVYCVTDLGAAKSKLADLDDHESVITPEGVWLGAGWLRQPAGAADDSGLLQREQEIRELGERIETDDERIAEIESQLTETRAERERLEAELSEEGSGLESGQREHARLQGQLSSLESRLENLERQRKAALEEVETLKARQAEDGEAVSAARRDMEAALERMQEAEAGREPLQRERRELDETRQQARARLAEARKRREELSLKVESSRAGLESLRQSIERMDNQVGQLQSRYLELSEALAQGDEPVAAQQKKRDEFLDERLKIEERLREARSQLESLEARWREQDEIRQKAAGEVEQIRGDQSSRQLALKETQLKAETIAGRIAELDADLDGLLAELPEGAAAEKYQNELESLEQKIRRLEPVNLAAIDEYEAESERNEYLERQHNDLVEALETLEKAISRIDRDTRTRFRETFEQVNKNMEALFPRLFGGGHGHLEMVGEDWLSAGVAILARPPGKRIARIHLLSGGEKALTAVAFVFSIFNLNPAPFCLLDEVDAPLDDANVGRFSDMVREMSEQVQFLVVTHNKVTMEVAHQMLGVTMREPGVSRMVSVDLDRAVALAQA
ncbi:chromosome segregation protein SMC [Wenzhouxiangella sp. EGI_FJ10305]|uniref:chromosome segregation protein SMC n=1 Tax=Wenzhouxiangella sp. EGI_FJ10305 TaxID=3243768 RepID=UPI0035D935DA